MNKIPESSLRFVITIILFFLNFIKVDQHKSFTLKFSQLFPFCHSEEFFQENHFFHYWFSWLVFSYFMFGENVTRISWNFEKRKTSRKGFRIATENFLFKALKWRLQLSLKLLLKSHVHQNLQNIQNFKLKVSKIVIFILKFDFDSFFPKPVHFETKVFM